MNANIQGQKARLQKEKERVGAANTEVARTAEAHVAGGCWTASGYEADYSEEGTPSVPRGAFMDEGSGNPVRAARLQPGEPVVGLGCGAAMEVFLVAHRVGKAGHRH